MRKPKGYWQNRDNCIKEALALVKENGLTEVPSTRELAKAGFSKNAMQVIGGIKGFAKIPGLPIAKSCSSMREANQHAPEKWEGTPSRAFQIEAEAREKGMCYADIQKAKTLAMVGGVQI